MGMRRCQEVGRAQSVTVVAQKIQWESLWQPHGALGVGKTSLVWRNVLGLFEDCNSWKSHFPKRSFLGYGFWGFLFCFVLFLRFLSELVMTVPENHSLLY